MERPDDEVIYRYLAGQQSAEEEEAIRQWYLANPEESQKEIDRVRFVMESVLIHKIMEDSDMPAASPSPPKSGTMPRKSFRAPAWIMMAAAVAIFTIGSFFISRMVTLNEVSGRLLSCEAPYGQRVELSLEDGTRVWLNSGARLEYPAIFGRRTREVTVHGEAMFDVMSDPGKPFIVNTFASQIEVVGTKFNVVADEQAGVFSTSLIRGQIRVTAEGQTILLQPDQTASFNDGRLEVSPTTDENALLWTDGIISLKDICFEDLMSRFEKAYGVRIICQCEDMPEIGLASGKLRISDGIDHALKTLQHIADFGYVRDEASGIIYIQDR